MDRNQILAIIDGLSQHVEGKKEILANLEMAFEYCSRKGTRGRARLIKGDLSGIQAFIYNVNQAEDVDGGVAKRLRGRSFYLSVFCLAMAEHLLSLFRLPKCCLLSWSGGKFLIISPESGSFKKKVDKWKEEIDDWLFGEFMGDLFLNLAISDALTTDKLNDEYIQISQSLQNELELHKLKKFDCTLLKKDLEGQDGVRYSDRVFDTDYREECHSCKRLPKMESVPERNLCCVCSGLENIGGFKGVQSHPSVMCDTRRNLERRGLWEEDKIVEFRGDWAVALCERGVLGSELIPAFSPELYKEEGLKKEELCDKACTLEPFKRVKEKSNCDGDRLATRFHCLAALVNDKAPTKGNKKIAVMAGDMDYLSVIMNSIPGVKLEDAVVLSELIYRFFADEMIKLLDEYKIYLAYSGGDDFVVIGAWDSVLDFACELSKKWDDMMPAEASPMERLTFSAGVQITNPQYPIYEGIDLAQRRMKNAKEKGRNRIDVMKVVMEWETFRKALDKAKWLKDRVRDAGNPNGPITIGFLFKMYDVLKQYEKWHKERKPVGLQYASQLTTHIQRNVAENPAGDEVKKFLHPLLKFNDETLLPHLRFILDWVVLMKRD